MRSKWRSWRLRLWGGELFGRTERKLTLLYSGVLIAFLAVFVGIVYGLLRYMIMNDQNQELAALADRQQLLLQNHVRIAKILDSQVKNNAEVMAFAEEQLFLYILSNKGQLVQSMESGRWDREPLLEAIRSWSGDPRVIREAAIDYKPGTVNERKGPRGYKQPLQAGEAGQIRLLITGRPIMLGNNQVGLVFIGKNISYHYELLNWMLLVLCGLALLFFAIALWISSLLSRRAMVPVRVSYTRQLEFVADASHELRTPLSVIQSSVEALELEHTGETDPFVRKLTNHMKDEVKRMAKLTGDLLTLARSDSPDQEPRREELDLAVLTGGVADAMLPVAEAKGIRLVTAIPSSIPATGDPERLKQLVYILLDNAVKYTPSGGTVTVQTAAEGKAVGKKHAVLTVKDTGIGISPEDQPRIFDRFYRADKSRSRHSGGYGLGLSIASSIVQAHHGRIRVFSTPGEGSTFTVELPLY